jgi:hypothetical protein
VVAPASTALGLDPDLQPHGLANLTRAAKVVNPRLVIRVRGLSDVLFALDLPVVGLGAGKVPWFRFKDHPKLPSIKYMKCGVTRTPVSHFQVQSQVIPFRTRL